MSETIYIPIQIADLVSKLEAEDKQNCHNEAIQSVSVSDVPFQTAGITHHLNKIDIEKVKEDEENSKKFLENQFFEKYDPRKDTPIQLADLLVRYVQEHPEQPPMDLSTRDVYSCERAPQKEQVTAAPRNCNRMEMVAEVPTDHFKDIPHQIADVVKVIEETPLFNYVEEDITKFIPFQIADIVYRMNQEDQAHPVKFEVDKYEPRRHCPVQIADVVTRIEIEQKMESESPKYEQTVVRITEEECKSVAQKREIVTCASKAGSYDIESGEGSKRAKSESNNNNIDENNN